MPAMYAMLLLKDAAPRHYVTLSRLLPLRLRATWLFCPYADVAAVTFELLLSADVCTIDDFLSPSMPRSRADTSRQILHMPSRLHALRARCAAR